MSDTYQIAKADGHLDWSAGASTFEKAWERAYDLLRFHRGKRFTIQHPPDKPGPGRTLNEIEKYLGPQVTSSHADDVFIVASLDDGYEVKFRKHAVVTSGDRVIAHAKAVIGTSYVLGGTDCSWLTLHCYGLEGVDLPHKAGSGTIPSQLHDDDLIHITKAQIKPGDLLFVHGNSVAVDHVAIYLDGLSGGRVIDEEPSGVQGPWGAYIPGGCQIRPMSGNYYCNWGEVVAIGRSVKINGKP